MVEAVNSDGSKFDVTFEVQPLANNSESCETLSTCLKCSIDICSKGLQITSNNDLATIEIPFSDFNVFALQSKALPKDQMIYGDCQLSPKLGSFLRDLGVLEDEHFAEITQQSQNSNSTEPIDAESLSVTITIQCKSDVSKLHSIAQSYKTQHFSGQSESEQ